MILKASMNSRQSESNIKACDIQKIVELSPAEFAEFTLNLYDAYDFISEFNKEKHSAAPNTQAAILVLGEHEQDGILVDPQGYDYARYSAYIPNARDLVKQEQYPSLNAFTNEMRWTVDQYTQKAVDGQIDCQYSIDLNKIYSQFRHDGFSEELFMNMISDRPEFESVEADVGYCIVTVAEPYLRQENESLRELTSEDVEIMCAKHILWLHDAGGEQADFSNCLLADMDLSRKNLINAVFNGAKLSNTKLRDAELCFSVFNNAKIYNCDLTNVIAEEAEFKNAECIGSDFDTGCFTHSDFTDARIIDCSMEYGSLQNCCLDGTEFGDMDLKSTSKSGCSYDRKAWYAEQDGSAITMQGE